MRSHLCLALVLAWALCAQSVNIHTTRSLIHGKDSSRHERAAATATDAIGSFISMIKPYQHTPWDRDHKTYFLPASVDPANAKNLPKQSHSGNLLEHSAWTVIAAARFIATRDPTYGDYKTEQDKKEVLVAAFVHDAGKALSCAPRCQQDSSHKLRCWYDTYSDLNYDGRGDGVHPEYSGDWVMGFKKGHTACPKEPELVTMWGTDTSMNPSAKVLSDRRTALNKWIRKQMDVMDASAFFSGLSLSASSRSKIALAAYMHWEFGRINAPPNPSSSAKFTDWIKKFKMYCGKLHLQPTPDLAKFCITVAAADIVAGSAPSGSCSAADKGVHPIVGQICNAACGGSGCSVSSVYEGTNPWEAFGMNTKGKEIAQKILKCLPAMTTGKQQDCTVALK